MKTQHKNAAGFNVVGNKSGEIVGMIEYDEDERDYDNYMKPPYRSGDTLYVRETWRPHKAWSGALESGCEIEYAAGGIVKFSTIIAVPNNRSTAWRPSIHMPKEAARIFLRVKDVRVERLQDIAGEDCVAEGCDADMLSGVGAEFTRGVFSGIWDSTIKKSDLPCYGWDANPWVWVYEFERIAESEV